MSTNKVIPWKFLSDEAVDKTDRDSFGTHSAYAKLLLEIARTAATPFSIALYSSWGTGKTSVAKMLQSLATKERDIAVVYLDVWKYSSDPLKRWILLETSRQLEKQGILDSYKYQDRTLQSHLEFEELVEDENRVAIDYKLLFRFLGGIVLFLAIVVICSLFIPDSLRSNGVLSGLIIVLTATGLTSAVLISILIEFLKSASGLVFRRTIRQVTAKPAFSSEKFGEIFQHLVKTATAKKAARILFVFDNLDRCSEGVAVEAIGVIKTYLDEPSCVYLIPCDENALVRHISRAYAPADGGEENAKEFLNKFFQTTVRLPVATDFDIERFVDGQLTAAGMTDLPLEARDVLVFGYLGQTPRQIKRVINDLIAYRSLAEQCERDRLVGDKELTGDLPLLTKMAVISEKWPDLLNKMGDDPDLWSDLTEKLGPGASTSASEVGLAEFLNATRHVSPNSDPRPYIFLKRVDFERDVPLSKSVEDYLRRGELAKYEDLIKQEPEPSRLDIVVRKSVAVCRQWLANEREGFLKNAAPLLVRAALLLPAERELRMLALSVLEFLAGKLSPDQLEEVLNVADVLDLDPGVTTPGKKAVLSKVVALFLTQFEATASRRALWQLVLGRQEQLTAQQKADVAASIKARYKSSKTAGEEDVLGLLGVGLTRPKDFYWCVDSALLSEIISNTEFSRAPIDVARVDTLVAYQSRLGNAGKQLIVKMVSTYEHSDEQTYDETAQRITSALEKIDPSIFDLPDLGSLGTSLLNRVVESEVELKANWLAPMIHIYSALPETPRAAVEEFLSEFVGAPADPDLLLDFLKSMGRRVSRWLLSVPACRAALRSQPEHLQRLGNSQGRTYREQYLECFDATELLAVPEVFDESRISELAGYVNTVQRAAGAETASLEDLRGKLVEFCRKYVVGSQPDNVELYEVVSQAVTSDARLLDAAVAVALAKASMALMAMDDAKDPEVEEYYKEFRIWKKELSDESQGAFLREVATTFLKDRKDHWLSVIQLMAEDVADSEFQRKDRRLVKELIDYSFGAAEEEPEQGTEPLLRLLPYLANEHAAEYLDRGLDTLLTYKADRKPLERMEPFLRMIEKSGDRLTTEDVEKAAKFCKRMLGAASSREEHVRTLAFVANLKHDDLTNALRGDLEQVVSWEDQELAGAAKALLGQA